MKRVSLLMMALVLSGCGSDKGHDDLERFISKTYASAEVTATPLPPKPTFSPLAFAPPVKTDPFVLPIAAEEEALAKGDCWQPERLSTNDPLERFELSSLTFKGVIGGPGSYWALVASPDNSIHRVGIGRMLGSNRGRVDSISQQTLSLTEHLPDGLGCWQVRNVRLALNNKHKGTE